MTAMKRSRGVGKLILTPSGIRSISRAISSWTRSSFSIVRDIGVGGGCLGYGGRFGVDLDLCKSRGRRESVDLVFRSKFSMGESKSFSLTGFMVTDRDVICILVPCCHQMRKPFQIPMSLRRSGILSI